MKTKSDSEQHIAIEEEIRKMFEFKDTENRK